MSPRTKSRTFSITESYHLYRVDRWWAGLLRHGAKEIVDIEWEALGALSWKLRVHWRAVESTDKLNVGHPEYADYVDEDLQALLHDTLSNFEMVYTDYTALEKKVMDWGVSEKQMHGRSQVEVVFRDDLDDAEKMIAIDYLWPQYRNLKKLTAFLAVQLRELEAELKAREANDYFAVKVDRGMLREGFVAQIGYDNDFLFEEVEYFPPDTVD